MVCEILDANNWDNDNNGNTGGGAGGAANVQGTMREFVICEKLYPNNNKFELETLSGGFPC